jgi:hypothetical protein
MKNIFLIAAFVIPSLSFAQNQTSGKLTVISEYGDRFYLSLDGVAQNTVPQTTITIADLTQPHYKAKVVFEDSTIASISRSSLMLIDYGKFMDVTYKIKRDRNNNLKLIQYSMLPIQ